MWMQRSTNTMKYKREKRIINTQEMNNLLLKYERKFVPHRAADEIILQEQSSPYTTPTNIRGSVCVLILSASGSRLEYEDKTRRSKSSSSNIIKRKGGADLMRHHRFSCWVCAGTSLKSRSRIDRHQTRFVETLEMLFSSSHWRLTDRRISRFQREDV